MPDETNITAQGLLYERAGVTETLWQLPAEVPIAIQINSNPYVVMMATPADLTDFGTGFVLAEGVVRQASDVKAVLVLPQADGFALDLAIDEDKIKEAATIKRSMEGRSGCGLCGIEDINQAIRLPKGHSLAANRLDPEAVQRAYENLPQFQPMNAVNHTVHAAAWCETDGRIILSREDVGRHNALDKLIGALVKMPIDWTSGFVLMSSRCSFELVQKCAFAGITALATISAPTALALRVADRAGIQLAAHSRKGIMIFRGAA